MGGATRRGDKVLRPSGPWTPTIHAFLSHLRAKKLPGVPQPFGLTADGREELEFINGIVPHYPMPDWLWTERILDDAAVFLRKVHDASLDFAVENARWQLRSHEPAEVICHNDFAPYNLVFREQQLVAAIDFDTCSPGPRAWDVSYLAYRLVPLCSPENRDGLNLPWAEKAHRLTKLIASYGMLTAAEVVDALPERLRELADFSEARGLAEHATLYRRDAEWVLTFRDLLVRGQS